jgi:hypothetical protein
MSSSRSVAAARARRAGDIVQKPPMSVRQQQQQMMGQRPNPNQRMTAPAAVMPESSEMARRPKIEVGTAIGLVTLRLGRLEQFIQQITENGQLKKDLLAGGGSSLPDNSKVVDNSVFTTLLSRVDGVERKHMQIETEVKSLKDAFLNLNATVERINREINEKMIDYEAALGDIESRIQFQPDDIIAGNMGNIDDEDGHEGISYEISEDA